MSRSVSAIYYVLSHHYSVLEKTDGSIAESSSSLGILSRVNRNYAFSQAGELTAGISQD